MKKQGYSAKFDKEIYSKFKKLSSQNGYKLNSFLNLKIREYSNKTTFKKYETNHNYKSKCIFLDKDLHRKAKNAYYLKNKLTIRDFIQSILETVIEDEYRK